ncbi:MAG: hypothetical protein R3E86_15170 [Pseudomonadales bacterium]
MSDKPSYLGLLNAIAVGEQRGHALLTAWRDATSDRGLAATLDLVAIREQEHAAAFTKRLCELGYSVRESVSEAFPRQLALARSNAPDSEKFRQILGYVDSGEERDDPLARLFDDHSIDPLTGALLGRFIAEERDSERRLRSAHARLEGAGTDDPMLHEIVSRLDRLTATLEDLRKLRG